MTDTATITLNVFSTTAVVGGVLDVKAGYSGGVNTVIAVGLVLAAAIAMAAFARRAGGKG